MFFTVLALSLGMAQASAQNAAVKSQQAAGERSRTKAQKYIESVATNDILRHASFGVFAMTEGGKTIASFNQEKRLVPASTMKLISSGAAMHQLGADFKFTTRIGYSGEIKDGVLEGDLYIVGGGDPTIASKDSIALRRDALFAQWKGFLDKAGIKKINGMVIGDGRYLDGPIERDSWQYQDIGTAYGSGFDGLCFYENAIDMKEYFLVGSFTRFKYTCLYGFKGISVSLYKSFMKLSDRFFVLVLCSPFKDRCHIGKIIRSYQF